ncbi:Mn/Fe superoxide dismutase family [Zostera marina]|uniref:superoxide dismutase n=1 Tax=Zostera marina TaxID=29655 RepID=A0A0K9Q4M8_ZOSMR|nr:Mn/Fe superoxide dismutase family [Zostera marina]
MHGAVIASLSPSTSSSSSSLYPALIPFSGCISLTRQCKTHKVTRRRRAASITAQIELKPPPYSLNSLEPHMSSQTLEYHWGRHHKNHVEGLNRQIVGTELDAVSLEDIITVSYNRGNPLPAFNNASQIWNHDFFWNSMKPDGGGHPSGVLLELIERDFGSYESMLKEFKHAALNQFGSGWVWLAYKANKLDVGNAVNPFPSEKDNKLVVAKTPNAINPLVWDYSPILAIDLWEHAYCLDHENRREEYISIFMEKLVSWDVVSSRLEIAMERAAERAREKDTKEENEHTQGDDEGEEMYLDSENEDSEAE